MTTILQSCPETKFIETTTVKLKVAPPKTSSESCSSWSFLQILSSVSSTPKETMEEENVYVHPLTKQYSSSSSSSSSSSRLSEKSLELCTENLGSETGSDDHSMDISILSLFPSSNSSPNSPTSSGNSWLKQEISNPPQEVEYSSSNSKQDNKVAVNNNSRKFPPPLTTMSGSNPLQFRPHREDGRLVIQAVEAPLKHTYFQAERSHGRLRLSYLEDHAIVFDLQFTRAEEIVDEVDDSDAVDVDTGDNEYQDEDHYQLEEEEYYDDDDDDEEEEEEERVAYTVSRDMDDNIFDVEVEIGRENFQRLINSRCNEGGGHGNKGLICNWPKPLWVATS